MTPAQAENIRRFEQDYATAKARGYPGTFTDWLCQTLDLSLQTVEHLFAENQRLRLEAGKGVGA